jgi:nucleoside diphosphate kinase
VNEADFQMTVPQAQVFYAEHAGRPFYQTLVTMMTRYAIVVIIHINEMECMMMCVVLYNSGRVLALALRRDGAIRAWRALCGPTDNEEAKRVAPTSIRALYGIDKTRNAVHGSDSEESAERELRLVFNTFAVNILTTCAIIKPDAVAAGHEETILKIIAAEKYSIHRLIAHLSLLFK